MLAWLLLPFDLILDLAEIISGFFLRRERAHQQPPTVPHDA